MFKGSETDRLQLRELIDSYSDAVMRGDRNAWGKTWAEQAIWSFRPDTELKGRDAIVAHWASAMTNFRAVLFMASPGSIVIEGDEASIVTHTFEHLEPIAGPSRFQAGLYRDKARKTGEGWQFTERYFTPRELKI